MQGMKHMRISWLLLVFCLAIASAFASGGVEGSHPFVDDSAALVIYSPHEELPAMTSIKEFEERTGIEVRVVFAGTGELVDRIRKEQDEGKPSCDLLWGGGAESLAANRDLFLPYKSTIDDLVSSQDKDPEGYWIGESPVPVVIMYNTTLIAPEEVPERWSDLLDPKWKGKVAFANPEKSGSAYTILCTMLLALKGWDAIPRFAQNLDGKTMDGSAMVYQEVADGQYYIGLTQEKSAKLMLEEGKKVGIAYPAEGTSAVDDAIAMVKGVRHVEEAKAFIEFVLGTPNQKMMARLFNRRPVRRDLAPPEGLPEMKDIPLVPYDLSWASGSKKDILEHWNEVLR